MHPRVAAITLATFWLIACGVAAFAWAVSR